MGNNTRTCGKNRPAPYESSTASRSNNTQDNELQLTLNQTLTNVSIVTNRLTTASLWVMQIMVLLYMCQSVLAGMMIFLISYV